jgi:hypothetical protein
MKPLFFVAVFAAMTTLAGCALSKSIQCTWVEHDAIVAENARLVERQGIVAGYVADPSRIQKVRDSFVSGKKLANVYARDYNAALDALQRRSESFNERCAGLPPKKMTNFNHSQALKAQLAAASTVGMLMGQREQVVRAKATLLREQIDSATTRAEVEAVAWS